MARRRVKANTFKGEQNFNAPRFLSEFDGLGDLANLVGDEEVPDVSGTANVEMMDEEVEFPQTPNDPRLYDDVDDPGVDDVPGIPEGIELLGDYAGVEAQEDAMDEFTDTEPPSFMAEQEQKAGLPWGSMLGLAGLAGGAVGDYFSPQKIEELSEQNRQSYERAQRQAQGLPPEEVIQEDVVEEVATPQELPAPVQSAIAGERKPLEEINESDFPEDPGEMQPVEGSVEQIRDNSEAINVVARILKVESGELNEGVLELAQTTQDALTKQRDQLNQQEMEILQRMQSGEMSTMEKVALGIALAAPILLGLAFGGKAFAASAGALAQGASSYFGSMAEQGKKDTEKLGKIQEGREKLLDKEKANLKYIYENLKNPKLRSYIQSMDLFDTQVNEDGSETVILGDDAASFGDKIGIKSPTESGEALYYDANLLRDDDSVDDIKKAMKTGNEEYQAAKNSNRLIGEVNELMEIIGTQNPTLFSKLAQYIQPGKGGLLNLVYPDSMKTLTVDVQDENGNIQKVKALPLLQQYITALQDPYNKEYLGGTRLTEGVQKHWMDVFPNPNSIKNWMTSDFETMQAQGKSFQSILNQRVTDKLVGLGFLREPLAETLPINNVNFRNSPYIDAKSKKQIMSEDREKYKKREK